MSLTTASQITHRARCARAASMALASSQTRNFRFGFRRVWSPDPEFQRETCRRQRTFRFKYTEPISPLVDDVKTAMKSAIHSYWAVGGRARIHLGRYADPEAVQISENNAEGARPGQNIEDVERSPMETLLFGDQAESPDYIIDPITNRKVPKSTYGGVDIPIQTFKSYRLQFVAEKPQTPIFYDGAPPEAELAKYDQVQIDAEPWDPASRNAPHQTVPQSTPSWSYRGVSWHRNDGIVSSAGSSIAFWHEDPSPAELDQYKPVLHNEAEAGATPSPPAQSYTDLGDYKAVRAHEPNGKYKARDVDPTQEYDDLHKYGAVRAHEPDGKYKPRAVAEPAEEYEDLHKYGAVRAHEPDGKYKLHAVVDPAKEYDDLDKYTAVRAHEPDGKYKVLAVQDLTQEYEDLEKYNAVRAHEPDGKYKVHAVQDPTLEYDDLHKYGAVRAHEPDGKYKVRDVQDSTEAYDDLHTYQAFRAHEPDGKYKIEAVAVKPENLSHLERDPCLEAHESKTFHELADQDPTQQYEDLHKYGPVRAHEPDGMYKLRDVQDPTEAYDDLHKYGAYRAHEPDGKYKIQAVEDPTQEYDDLRQYIAFRSHEPDGKYAASYVEHKEPKDLKGYGAFRSHEPDGKYAASYVEPKVDGKELGSYKAYRSHEPDGKYAESYEKPEAGKHELGGYQAFRSHEPDGKYVAEQEQQRPDIDQAELGTYKAYLSHEPDGKYAVNHEPAEAPEDLEAYGAFRSYEPDGKYAALASTSPSATSSSPAPGKTAAGPPKYGAVRHYEPDGTPLTEPTENPSNPAELETCQAAGNAPSGRPTDPLASGHVFELRAKTNYREMLESLMARIAAESDAEDLKAAANVKRLKEKAHECDAGQDGRSLTGSYVRDFPEEFTKTWSAGQSSFAATLLPTDMERTAQEEREPDDDASFTTVSVPLQPALDRQPRRRKPGSRRARQLLTDDPYSHEPQGLQTSYAEEIGSQSTWPALVKHYGSVRSAQSEAGMCSSEAIQEPLAEPTLYKILAYDPALRAVDVAEATSVVPDQMAPLSPAEVLLRLTNPSQFLPHFASLQAQGFEIVSGSGDVLIFRKIRPAAPAMARQTAAGGVASGSASGPLVNPIDMTGGQPELPPVAAARYASPTGFVNYDLPGSPPLPFASGIDVRREEPVFSGQKREEQKDQGKPSLPKRVAIGAIFVGGVMYSVGVVGEYFKTGGSDGKGPKGF